MKHRAEQRVRVPLRLLFAWRPKLEATLADVREGRLSYSAGVPLQVSRLDTPRGGFFVVDGHHRAVEAALRGDAYVWGLVDANVPRIERTGGAHRAYVEGKANVASFVREVGCDRRRSRRRWRR